GRDSGDADAVAALGGDDPGDSGPVIFRSLRLADDEIAVENHLTREVRVVRLDAAVDHCNPNAASGGDSVEVRELPLASSGLRQVQRIVGRGGAALRLIQLHRL